MPAYQAVLFDFFGTLTRSVKRGPQHADIARALGCDPDAVLNVLDRTFAEGQIAVFEADKTRATRVTLESWRRRPWTEKAKEWLAGTFRLQL